MHLKLLSKWEAWNIIPPSPALSVYLILYLYIPCLFFLFWEDLLSLLHLTCKKRRDDYTVTSKKKKTLQFFLLLDVSWLFWPVGPSLWLLFTGLNLFIFIFLRPLVWVRVVYVVKEVASFPGAWSFNRCGA